MIFPDASLLDDEAEELAILRKVLQASGSRASWRQPCSASKSPASVQSLERAEAMRAALKRVSCSPPQELSTPAAAS